MAARTKKGRRTTGHDAIATIRLSSELRESVHAWAAKQSDKPARPVQRCVRRNVPFLGGAHRTHDPRRFYFTVSNFPIFRAGAVPNSSVSQAGRGANPESECQAAER